MCSSDLTHQDLTFWLIFQSMLIGTLEGHTHQFWAHFDMFWFFGIFEFLVKTHEIRHFSLGIRQRRRMVSLDAIILRSTHSAILRTFGDHFLPRNGEKGSLFAHSAQSISGL